MELSGGGDVLDVPDGWERVRVGDVATFASGQGISVATLKPRSPAYPIPVFGGNGIAGYTQRALTQTRSVVVGRVGQKCGAVYLTDGPAWITDNALYPTWVDRGVDLEFFALALAVAGLNDARNRNDLPLITQSILHATSIVLPCDVAEQQGIAAALRDMDALLVRLEQLLAKKRSVKQAAMQRLLTGEQQLPGFTAEWTTTRLGDVAVVDPESLGADTSPDYRFRYISLEDVSEGRLRGHSEQTFRIAPSRARRRLRPRDVLVATVRPNLMSHLLFDDPGVDWICSTGFAVVRCDPCIVSPEFIFHQLFGGVVTRQIDVLITGSNYPAINSGDVRALSIPWPTVAEQRAIAAVLSDMDAELAALDRRLAKTRAVKQAMMQDLLTGRRRLAPSA